MMESFKHPFTCLIAGPTGSGKTVLLLEILQNRQKMITPEPDRIIYCYKRYQSFFDKHKYIEFHEGLVDIDELDTNQNNIVIIDDLMAQSEQDKSVLDLFTVDSHHKNISVFFLSQNLFSQGKYMRTISLNCHYIILMNNPRDRSQINYLARQIFPTHSKFLVESYIDATSSQYGYLFLDFKQETDNELRVQTGILPNQTRIVYQIKC